MSQNAVVVGLLAEPLFRLYHISLALLCASFFFNLCEARNIFFIFICRKVPNPFHGTHLIYSRARNSKFKFFGVSLTLIRNLGIFLFSAEFNQFASRAH